MAPRVLEESHPPHGLRAEIALPPTAPRGSQKGHATAQRTDSRASWHSPPCFRRLPGGLFAVRCGENHCGHPLIHRLAGNTHDWHLGGRAHRLARRQERRLVESWHEQHPFLSNPEDPRQARTTAQPLRWRSFTSYIRRPALLANGITACARLYTRRDTKHR
jgi:hypothetical protein